jgi:hypothetical protein
MDPRVLKTKNASAMKTQNRKFQVAITTANLAFWVWVVSHMKQHGDHLGGPHLIALIATALALLICYRSVLAARQTRA